LSDLILRLHADKQVSDLILNKTVEVGKKIVGGAADVLGNISGEMKKP
jgi:hypothetical protein